MDQAEGIKTVGVVGAGTMGSGIAQACAVKGLDVVMVDIAQPAVERGLAAIAKSLDRLVAKGKLAEGEKAAALARIGAGTDYAALQAADMVIEAATENRGLKTEILAKLGGLLPPATLLASNTSSISITELAAASGRAERFVGMHFFNPVPMMALVEVIRGLQTSDETHAAAQALARRLGKSPISVKNVPGFVVNRLLLPMINEAFYVLAEGVASAGDIDAGMKLGCNHPIGPLELADMIGLDVCLSIMQVCQQEFGDDKYRPSPLLREYVAAGRLGRKTGEGVYRYGD